MDGYEMFGSRMPGDLGKHITWLFTLDKLSKEFYQDEQAAQEAALELTRRAVILQDENGEYLFLSMADIGTFDMSDLIAGLEDTTPFRVTSYNAGDGWIIHQSNSQ